VKKLSGDRVGEDHQHVPYEEAWKLASREELEVAAGVFRISDVRFEVFATIKTQVVVFGVVTRRSYAEYQRFGEPCCSHLQGERWYHTTSLHGITTLKIKIRCSGFLHCACVRRSWLCT